MARKDPLDVYFSYFVFALFVWAVTWLMETLGWIHIPGTVLLFLHGTIVVMSIILIIAKKRERGCRTSSKPET